MNPKDKYITFNDDNDLANKNISLNGPNSNQSDNKNAQPQFLNNIKGKGDDLAAGMVVRENKNSNVTEKASNAIIMDFNQKLGFIGQYFNVDVDEVKEKIISSIIPFNRNFHELAERNPDLYGPFWIFTTLILLISLAGNLSNFLEVRIRLMFDIYSRQTKKNSNIILISFQTLL